MWWHRRARPPLDELQGNVLTPYRRRPFAGYTFVRIGTATAGQQVLSELVPGVTTEAVSRTSHGPTLNIAVTYAGLAALGVDEDVRGSFPVAFREDMAGRAARLGDVADSAPSALGGAVQP